MHINLGSATSINIHLTQHLFHRLQSWLKMSSEASMARDCRQETFENIRGWHVCVLISAVRANGQRSILGLLLADHAHDWDLRLFAGPDKLCQALA